MGNHESLVEEKRAEFIALAITLKGGSDALNRCLWDEENPQKDFSSYLVFLFQPEIDDIMALFELWWECHHVCPADPLPADEFLVRISTLSSEDVQTFVDKNFCARTRLWCWENSMMKGNKLTSVGRAVADFVKMSWRGKKLLEGKCLNYKM